MMKKHAGVQISNLDKHMCTLRPKYKYTHAQSVLNYSNERTNESKENKCQLKMDDCLKRGQWHEMHSKALVGISCEIKAQLKAGQNCKAFTVCVY